VVGVVGVMLAVPALLDDEDGAVQAIELGPGQICPPDEDCTLVPRRATPSTSAPEPRPAPKRLTRAGAAITSATPSAIPNQRTMAAASSLPRPATTTTTTTTSPRPSTQPASVPLVQLRTDSTLLVRFSGKVTITNPGPTAIERWTLSFIYDGARITRTSGADGSYDGDRFIATADRPIAAGRSVSFRFEATGDANAQPSGCLLNDRPCRFG
jgi:hypothetical protein